MLPKELAEVREKSFTSLDEAETCLRSDEFVVTSIKTASDQIQIYENGRMEVEGKDYATKI